MKLLRAVLFFIATGLLYLGVSLLGWGLGDLEGYFSIAPRMGYAVVVGLFSHASLARWLGVVLSALGFALVFWSGVALGRQYSADVTIQKEHHLITSGVYQRIRHPRYLGVIALSVGVSCVFRSWIGLIASGFFIAALIYRISDEEAAMYKEFGNEWETYCKPSWCLIPYIF